MAAILKPDELKVELEKLKKEGKKIVFTNGCFDILHVGHISYLKEAKRLGDVLVVALNTDNSIRKIKPLRPIVSENQRATVLAALSFVDYVTFFDEETPYSLIKYLMPDVLVKGGDWKVEEIVGADIVKEVYSLPYLEGVSTTAIIKRVLDIYSNPAVNQQLLERAKKIKLLVLDVDGVLTDGKIIYDSEGNELKIFNVKDGHGIVMLKKAGINITVISARQSKAVERRMKELGVTEIYQGVREKLKIFNELMAKYKLDASEIAAMGDDVVDLSVLSRVGFSVAPQDAHEEVKRVVHYITKAKAGKGAVRELCDLILKAKGVLNQFIDEYKEL